jgi:hypothetical protein
MLNSEDSVVYFTCYNVFPFILTLCFNFLIQMMERVDFESECEMLSFHNTATHIFGCVVENKSTAPSLKGTSLWIFTL